MCDLYDEKRNSGLNIQLNMKKHKFYNFEYDYKWKTISMLWWEFLRIRYANIKPDNFKKYLYQHKF